MLMITVQHNLLARIKIIIWMGLLSMIFYWEETYIFTRSLMYVLMLSFWHNIKIEHKPCHIIKQSKSKMTTYLSIHQHHFKVARLFTRLVKPQVHNSNSKLECFFAIINTLILSKLRDISHKKTLMNKHNKECKQYDHKMSPQTQQH